MSSYRRHVSIGIFTAAAAGLTWAVATGTVDNYPATLRYTINMPGETITSVLLQAYPSSGGNPASTTVSGPLSGPIDLLVNGGDPFNAADLGIAYQPYAYVYLANPPASQTTYLRAVKNAAVIVDNTAAVPQAVVPVSYSYSAIRRINTAVNVISSPTSGNVEIYYYNLYSNYYDAAGGEQYYGTSSASLTAQTSISTWVPMVPTSSATIGGTAYLRYPDGTTAQRNLAPQIVNISGGNASVSWTIDLSNNGRLQGTVAAATTPVTPYRYTVQYVGTSTETSGISGSVAVTPPATAYAVDLTPGQYDVYVNAGFSSPASSADTLRERITIGAGAVVTKNFTPSYGKARVDVNVGGFYTTSGLYSLNTGMQSNNAYGTAYAYGSQRVGNGVEQIVPYGDWRSYYTQLQLYDNSTPSFPLNSTLTRYHYTDSEAGPTPVNSAGPTVVSAQAPTLVRANVYFDVIEAVGLPQVLISSPQINAYRNEYNSNGSLRRQLNISASGSGTAQAVSGFTVVGEPGTYNLTATGAVNGQRTTFGRAGSTLTFGTPVTTPGSGTLPDGSPAPVEVPLANQTSGSFLNLSVVFQSVGQAGGLTTLVENPLGPEPPEGFRMSCTEPVYDDAGNSICDPIYYDITTTAPWAGSAKVCVRRRSAIPNGIAQDQLKLFHYVAPNWDPMPPPADGTPAFIECIDDNLATCGCTTKEACGYEEHDNYTINAYLLCGETNAIQSGFAGVIAAATTTATSGLGTFGIFQSRYAFTNKVGGVEYTGPVGPPTGLQKFVAPSSGRYRLTAWGARGAKATATTGSATAGCGAQMAGDFTLQDGETLDILVGQMGTAATNSGGGGGGTFVVKNGAALLVAGGGGGIRSGVTASGRGGTTASAGTAGSTSSSYASGFIAGGTGGSGGARVVSYGAGGGGWSGAGASDSSYGDGGAAFTPLATTDPSKGRGGQAKSCSGGFAHGGYGGGGAGNGCYGGGGGGGYSGGGGGRIGGGGGSLNTGTNQQNLEGTSPGACTATGHGLVTIEYLGY